MHKHLFIINKYIGAHIQTYQRDKFKFHKGVFVGMIYNIFGDKPILKIICYLYEIQIYLSVTDPTWWLTEGK